MRETPDHLKMIYSSRGIGTYVGSVVTFVGAAVCLWGLIDAYILGNGGLSLLMTAVLLFCLVFFWQSVAVATTQIAISVRGIRCRDFSRNEYVAWENVTKIKLVPNYYGSYSVILVRSDRRRYLALPTGSLANGDWLAKAILEAGRLGNPSVEIAGAAEFGSPPYGIFTSQL